MGGNADIDRLTSSIADVNDGAQDAGCRREADASAGVGRGRATAPSALAASGWTGSSRPPAPWSTARRASRQGVSERERAGRPSSPPARSRTSWSAVHGDAWRRAPATYRASLAGQAAGRPATPRRAPSTSRRRRRPTRPAHAGLRRRLRAVRAATAVDPAADETATAAQGALQQALTDFVTAQATVAGYESAADALDGAASGYADIDAGIQGLVDEEGDASVYAAARRGPASWLGRRRRPRAAAAARSTRASRTTRRARPSLQRRRPARSPTARRAWPTGPRSSPTRPKASTARLPTRRPSSSTPTSTPTSRWSTS